MADKRAYKNMIMDNARWEAFTPRDGDVIICTAYKAGTTWTQMICALLVHQTTTLPRPLAELSPWLDMRMAPIAEVAANYEGQTTRRFIKTHTPLDGLPYYDNVTYLFCGRDPRDIYLSMQNHRDNLDIPKLIQLMIAAGETLDGPPPEAPPEDLNARFQMWLTRASFDWEKDGWPNWSVFHHGQTFWEARDKKNVHFLHYADLKSDLEGQMRRIAGILGIEVSEVAWPGLVSAATFESMKAGADRAAPDTNHGIWKSNADFFRKGESGQWRGVLNDESLALYDKVTRERYDAGFLAWMEHGSAEAGAPKAV